MITNLKKWPYWLKGGIIALIAPLIFLIGQCESLGCIVYVPVSLPLIFFMELQSRLNNAFGLQLNVFGDFNFLIQPFNFISHFLLGAIIGLIYTHIKKK